MTNNNNNNNNNNDNNNNNNNNTNSTVYATIFINLGYTTCFDPKGSSSGVSSYILCTYRIAT
jgi:hypothetical protein